MREGKKNMCVCGRMEVNRVPIDFRFFPERARGMELWSCRVKAGSVGVRGGVWRV